MRVKPIEDHCYRPAKWIVLPQVPINHQSPLSIYCINWALAAGFVLVPPFMNKTRRHSCCVFLVKHFFSWPYVSTHCRDRQSWANGRGKSQSAIFSKTISKHHKSEIHHGTVTINLRVIHCAVLTVCGVNNPFNSESCRITWYILVLKKAWSQWLCQGRCCCFHSTCVQSGWSSNVNQLSTASDH